MAELIEVENLSVSFMTPQGEVQAVRNVSFSLKAGEVLAVVGESGCGKSVMCKSILKLLPSSARIRSGSIRIRGEDITGCREREMYRLRGKAVSMIFQDPMTSLNPTMTVGAQIAEAVRVHQPGMSRQNLQDKVQKLLQLAGIDRPKVRCRQYPYEFSGGMRQRIVLAAALASDPAVLIADEPTTALDVTLQAQILELLLDIRKKCGMAVLFVTHDLGVVAKVADRVAVMYAGKIVEIGTAEEIYQDPRHPYTWGLLRSLPVFSREKQALPVIPGMPPALLHPPEGDAFACRNAYALRIDYEKEPPMFTVSDTHYAATWLLDERAPECIYVKMREMQGRIDSGDENKLTELQADGTDSSMGMQDGKSGQKNTKLLVSGTDSSMGVQAGKSGQKNTKLLVSRTDSSMGVQAGKSGQKLSQFPVSGTDSSMGMQDGKGGQKNSKLLVSETDNSMGMQADERVVCLKAAKKRKFAFRRNPFVYFGKKLLVFLLSIGFLMTVVFYISRLAPGDPLVSYYGERAEKMSSEERARAENRLGLNDPVTVQYIRWLECAVHGDFGISYKYKTDVLEVIGGRIGNTFLLGGTGFLLIFVLALLLGILCAWQEERLPDRIICRVGTVTSCIPEFWLSYVLIFLFAVHLKWLPGSGAYAVGRENDLGSRMQHLILPLTVVVTGHLWYYAYLIRNRILEEVRADYVLFAKAKGLKKSSVMFRHCLRNAFPAYLSLMAVSIPHILGGTYIVETVFSYPGLGTLSYESARYQDYNLLMLLCIFSGIIVILGSMAAQIINERLDPRMKSDGRI